MFRDCHDGITGCLDIPIHERMAVVNYVRPGLGYNHRLLSTRRVKARFRLESDFQDPMSCCQRRRWLCIVVGECDDVPSCYQLGCFLHRSQLLLCFRNILLCS